MICARLAALSLLQLFCAAGEPSGRPDPSLPLATDEVCSDGNCGLGLLQRSDEQLRVKRPKNTEEEIPRPPLPLARELVHEVYTYGAPATHKWPFMNLAQEDGCFRGLRSYNEDIRGPRRGIHQVDAAAMNNYYPHAEIPSVVLHLGEDSYYTPCSLNPRMYGHPAWPQRGSQVYEEWRLHQEDDYTIRLDQVSINGTLVADEEPFLSARKFLPLAYKSYDTVPNTKATLKEKLPGWTLVERVVDVHGADLDPVMIVQQEETLDCAIVFTGTNSFSELATSTTQYGTGYCGFKKVHVGYRNELWTLTKNVFSKLRPAMEQCNRMICVGHSLGGALCEVFAACANSGHESDPDFQLLVWRPGTPTLMAEAPDREEHEGDDEGDEGQ